MAKVTLAMNRAGQSREKAAVFEWQCQTNPSQGSISWSVPDYSGSSAGLEEEAD
jgi:hypothetical protein